MDLRIDGPRSAPSVVLANALGTTSDLWEPQLQVLRGRFRVIRFEYPPLGDVGSLASELLAALDRTGIDRFSFCGVSLGAMVGMWIGAATPHRIDRLVLACATARFGTPAEWRERAWLVRTRGMEAVTHEALDKWFTPAYPERKRFLEMQLHYEPEAYARGLEAIGRFDFRNQLGEIQVPTLVIAGSEDVATTPADAAALAHGIPRAWLVVLAGAAHLANVEQPEAFNAAVLEHLGQPAR